MIFSGKFFMKKAPFKKIYIHPTVLTKDGKRMSKSLGTGIDPVGLIETYGTDALRFGLAYQNTGVQDLRFGEDHILMGKKFANKLWNMNRYVVQKVGEGYQFDPKKKPKNAWTQKMDELTASVSSDIEQFNFGKAAHDLYEFVWHEFADKYIEESKNSQTQETKDTLAYLLFSSLRILHPFMPFVTEEIYQQLSVKNKKLFLMIETWPGATK
jgi:valyl-tRNA synthetase